MRVCFLTGSLGLGGAERQLLHMVRLLSAAGVQVHVLYLASGALKEDLDASGIPSTWVGRSRRRWVRLGRITAAAAAFRPHLLQCAHFYTNLYGAVAGWVLRVPVIGAIRGEIHREVAMNGVISWGHLRSPSHIVANSELARRRAVALGVPPDRISFLPNAVSLPGRDSMQRTYRTGSDVELLYVGRVSHEKRPDRFLRLLARLSQELPEGRWKGRIVGDGVLRQDMEGLARELGLGPDRIEFHGQVRDVSPYYETSDILVLTSDSEGTPNVILEAMAYGLPVVATSVGGVPEVLSGGRGLMVDPEDEDGLANEVGRLASDLALRLELSERGRRYVAAVHDPGRIASDLLAIHARVLTPKTRPVVIDRPTNEVVRPSPGP